MSRSRVYISLLGISAGVMALLALACEVPNLTAVLAAVAAFALGYLWHDD